MKPAGRPPLPGPVVAARGRPRDESTEELFDCDDFPSRALAQRFLAEYPHDPSGLDGDDDGVACEDNR
jgi:hypothetical protein